MTMPIPTSRDVVAWLNDRFAERGLTFRVSWLNVVPYMNPMWVSNWELAEVPEGSEGAVVEEEVREARWRFPQIYDESFAP
jgi:hypothetical protein